jgi:uncharacterized protein (DUF58 family)
VNNFLWILIVLLALALSWFAESALLAWAACVSLLILIASRLLVRFTPAVDARRNLSSDYIHAGDSLSVSVRLNLPRRSLGWLQVSEAAPPLPFHGSRGVILSPLEAKEAEFSYTISGVRRGYFNLGPLSLRCGDALGFAEKQKTLLEAQAMTVFPHIVEMKRMRLPIARAPGELQTMRRTFEDSTRPAGIRAYRQGDALRRVHWKATAHSGSPKSRIYDVCTTLQAMIVLNLHRPDYPPGPAEAEQTIELAISLAGSLAVHILSASQRVGLMSNGLDVRERDKYLQEADMALLPESVARLSDEFARRWKVLLPPSRRPEQPLEILSLLARLQPSNGRSLGALLEEARFELSWGETLMVITSRLDDAVVGSLAGILHAGFPVLALVVGESPLATRAHLRLAAAGISSRRVISEEDIGGLFA